MHDLNLLWVVLVVMVLSQLLRMGMLMMTSLLVGMLLMTVLLGKLLCMYISRMHHLGHLIDIGDIWSLFWCGIYTNCNKIPQLYTKHMSKVLKKMFT